MTSYCRPSDVELEHFSAQGGHFCLHLQLLHLLTPPYPAFFTHSPAFCSTHFSGTVQPVTHCCPHSILCTQYPTAFPPPCTVCSLWPALRRPVPFVCTPHATFVLDPCRLSAACQGTAYIRTAYHIPPHHLAPQKTSLYTRKNNP